MRRIAIFFVLAGCVARAGFCASSLPPAYTSQLRFTQHMGAPLPLDTQFRDGNGQPVYLRDYFGARPVVLVLEYLRCRSLCGVVLKDAARALAGIPLVPGRDYQVVAVSIDPRDTPADALAARKEYLTAMPAQAAKGWHFLTGPITSIRAIADAVGFPFRYDPKLDQYAHPAGITVVTAQGRISRYLLGVGYRPLDARLALSEAAAGRVSSAATDLLLLCYCYDPETGRYSLAIRDATRILCAGTVVGIVLLMLRLTRMHRS